MLTQPPLLVIFDCDGVLVNSEPIANEALREALATEGIELDIAEVRRRYVGLSMKSVVALIEMELGRALRPGWLDELQAFTFARLRTLVKPIPYVREAVERIHAAGIKTCVASSGSIAKMTLTLGTTGLLPLFNPRLFSSMSLVRGKPHPDLFQWAGRTAGIVPNRTVVIEDAIPGVQAARAANMTVFGYAGDPFTDAEALKSEGATVFPDMRKLPELLHLRMR
jgi:HAD superfamily hydrolase (TIGR01509 family)